MSVIYKVLPEALYYEALIYVPDDVLKKHNWSRPSEDSINNNQLKKSSVDLQQNIQKQPLWKRYEDEFK